MRPGRSDVPDRPTAGGAEELSGPSQIFFERKNVRINNGDCECDAGAGARWERVRDRVAVCSASCGHDMGYQYVVIS